jgi:hypothetical protein
MSRDNGYDFFPNFNQEQSYALGLLWADGWMTQSKGFRAKYLRIEVLQEDFQDFRFALSSVGKLTERIRLRKDRKKPVVSACISNKALCEWLFNNDFKEKSMKSPVKILSYINKKYHKDFMRGWIDGDGCFYVNIKNNCFQFILAGSYEQDWTAFSDFLNENQIEYKIVNKKQIQNQKENKHSILRITKRNSIIRLKELIYENADFYLKRKHDKAFQIPLNKRKQF